MQRDEFTPIIFGASGLLGTALYNYFSPLDPQTIGTYARESRRGLLPFQLNKTPLSALPLQSNRHYHAIICAAITNINYINTHPDETALVNVQGTLKLIAQLTERGIPITFISSDNVFRGDVGGYSDCSVPQPVSVYGQQKRTVEQALMQQTDGQCSIIRLSKIIGVAGRDNSILNDITRQLLGKAPVKAAADLIFNPTALADIVQAVGLIMRHQYTGYLNFCNPEAVSRYQLALRLADALAISADHIIKINFRELAPSGQRPLNTSMYHSACFADFAFTHIDNCIRQHLAFWN